MLSFRAFSISEGEMFLPPLVMMIAFLRSTIISSPFGASATTSPVCSQPSCTVSAVALSSCR